MHANRPNSVHLRTARTRCKLKTACFPESTGGKFLAGLGFAALYSAICACAASQSSAKNWLYPPGVVGPQAGLSVHFGGFTNISAAIDAPVDSETGQPPPPGPLPDPLAFAEHFVGDIPQDAFSAGGPDIHFEADREARTPAAAESDSPAGNERGLICLRNLRAILFGLEAGLRMEYCLAGHADGATTLRATIAGIYDANRPTAYPRYSDGKLEIQAQSPAELRRSLDPAQILVSIDGGRVARLAAWRLASAYTRFAYDYSATDDRAGPDERAFPLPRRFPGGEFDCLLTQNTLYWMFTLPNDSNRLLVVRIEDADAVRAARIAFARIPRLLAAHIQHSRTREIQPGEIYFRHQSLALSADTDRRPDEFVELASGSEDAFAKIRLSGETAGPANEAASAEREVFLFAHSTRLISRSANFRFDGEVRYRAGADANETSYRLVDLPNGVLPRRSYVRTIHPPDESPTNAAANSRSGGPPTAGLHANTACRGDFAEYARLCANPGIAPQLARALQERELNAAQFPESAPLCEPGDFTLSEFNPTGVYLPLHRRLADDGKFLELQVRRDCRSDAVWFRVGGTLLDPGSARLRAGQTLLFIAARDPRRYLDSVVDPSSGTALFSAPALRSSRAGDSIAVYTARTENSPAFERVLRPAAADVLYWTGIGNTPSDHLARETASDFRAVHSLEFRAAGAREAFSAGAGTGLRPDLRAFNAMSPGRFSEDASPRNTETVIASDSESDSSNSLDVQISEVLPAGGYDLDLQSLPGEEFIEFHAFVDPVQPGTEGSPRDRYAGWELRIIRETDTDADATVQQRIRFPSPERAGRFVFRRAASRCFAQPAAFSQALLGRLSLPNAAARYELIPLASPDADPRDRFRLDAAFYSELDRAGQERASASRSSGMTAPGTDGFGEFWRRSDGPAATSPYCGRRTLATPGAPAAFAPFLQREDRPPFRLRLYSEDGPRELRLRLSADSNVTFVEVDVFAEHGQTLDLAALLPPGFAAYPRILYTIHANDRRLGAGEIFASDVPLIVSSVAPTPPPGQVEWIRLCSPDGFSLSALANVSGAGAAILERSELRVADSHSHDRIVPFNERSRISQSPVAALNGDSLELAAGACALLVDPDFAGQGLPTEARDAALWTIAESSAIGNGLSAGEGLRIYAARDARDPGVTLASYGRPDLPDPFSLSVSGGRYVSRIAPLSARLFFDEAALFEMRTPE